MVAVLNVAEKPSVAKEISNILSQGSCRRVCIQKQDIYPPTF